MAARYTLNGKPYKAKIIVVAALAATVAQAEFKIDRSVMNEAYWKLWNDKVQAKIDADIEKYRKADGAFALEGAPDGAEVRVEQVAHAFQFGSHIFHAKHARLIAAGEPCIANGTSWAPEDQIAMLRKLDTIGRPIHLSEITIPAFDDSPKGWAQQAQLARDNYRLWFSWPTIYRITWWNLVDYTYHKESLASGLYTKDMKKKPVYHALDNLINHEWKTTTTAKASAGKVSFRGFRGRYRLAWRDAEGKERAKFVELK